VWDFSLLECVVLEIQGNPIEDGMSAVIQSRTQEKMQPREPEPGNSLASYPIGIYHKTHNLRVIHYPYQNIAESMSNVSSSSSNSKSSKESCRDPFYNNFDLFDGAEFFVDSPQSKEKASACIVTRSMPSYLQSVPGLTERLGAVKSSLVTDLSIAPALAEKCKVGQLMPPGMPFFLLPTNFACPKPLDRIVTTLTALFHDYEDKVDFQFVRSECCFHGLYSNNNRRTDFHLAIYENCARGGFVLEMQRLDCDSCCFAFNEIYQLVRSILDPLYQAKLKKSVADDPYVVEFSLSTDSGLSDEELTICLAQVVSMASAPDHQSKLEAARILSDMAEDTMMRQPMAAAGCITTLAQLLSTKKPIILEQAVLTLAQLSECRVCAEAIVQENILPKLMSLTRNGSYATAKMRRESARIIANLADQFASEMVTAIGKEAVQHWMRSIPDLQDRRLKDRCMRARSCFQDVSSGL